MRDTTNNPEHPVADRRQGKFCVEAGRCRSNSRYAGSFRGAAKTWDLIYIDPPLPSSRNFDYGNVDVRSEPFMMFT